MKLFAMAWHIMEYLDQNVDLKSTFWKYEILPL